jgi:hypothetical protein
LVIPSVTFLLPIDQNRPSDAVIALLRRPHLNLRRRYPLRVLALGSGLLFISNLSRKC